MSAVLPQAGLNPKALPAGLPENGGCQPGALDHGFELGPGDSGVDHWVQRGSGAEPAVGSRHHVLAANHLCIANDPLLDQLGVLDEVGRGVEHPGYQHLAARQLDSLEHPPLMGVARVGSFDQKSHRSRLQQRADEVGQRHVSDVRPLVVTPANMEAHAVGGDISDGVVERLDVDFGRHKKLTVGLVGVFGRPSARQVRPVELQHQPGLMDGVVLVFEQVRQRKHVRLFTAVIPVHDVLRGRSWRRCRHENLARFRGTERCLQCRDVVMHRVGVVPDEGSRAGRSLPAIKAPSSSGMLREVPLVQRDERTRVAHQFQTPDAVSEVVQVAGLALLAVVDDVDARVNLLADNVGHGLAHARLQSRRIDRLSGVAVYQQFHQIRRTRKAAGMRGQNPVDAALDMTISWALWQAGRTADGISPYILKICRKDSASLLPISYIGWPFTKPRSGFQRGAHAPKP